MTMKNIITGMELECIVNTSKRSVIKERYGKLALNKGLVGWRVTSDSSVRSTHENVRWKSDTVNSFEFVSQKIAGKKQFQNVMNSFKKFISHDGKYELNEVVSFNSTCGAHVHISIKNFKFKDKTFYLNYPKVRKYFFEKVKASTVISKEHILNHYFRGYAKRFQKNYMKGNVRSSEFNFISESEGTGLEWRSVNLLNIKTWKEFDEMVMLVWDCLEYLYEQCTSWKTNLVITRTDEMIKKTLPVKNSNIIIKLNKVKESNKTVKI